MSTTVIWLCCKVMIICFMCDLGLNVNISFSNISFYLKNNYVSILSYCKHVTKNIQCELTHFIYKLTVESNLIISHVSIERSHSYCGILQIIILYNKNICFPKSKLGALRVTSN